MALPAPSLDDRRFQDLVDDAKRLVQQRCPRWTDHNVSDPGITLIEAVASMTEQLIYRLNRVPDRNYIKFLELLGVTLFPPTAARAPITFWLSAAQPDTVRIPAGTQVATVRTETDDAISFETVDDLSITTATLHGIASMVEGGKLRDHGSALLKKTAFYCFDTVPKPGDALYVALSEPVPSCIVVLRFQCEIEGVGVDPERPPLAWEAWDGEQWVQCEVDHDDTGGLNKDGDLVLHVPPTHVALILENDRAGWLRGRLTVPEPDQPMYASSPKITGLSAFTIGGTVEATNAELIELEDLGVSDGTAGQRFVLKHGPVVPGDDPPILEVSSEAGWDEWTAVDEFSSSTENDLHFAIDQSSGEILLGPAVLLSGGDDRQFGAIPPKDSRIRLRRYRVGGGRQGNVSIGTIRALRSSIPYVARVENRRPAQGGVDAESIDNAKIRGPIELRTRRRAVTAEDFEYVAREAAPEAARIRAVSAGDGQERGGVRVLVVPNVTGVAGKLDWEQLDPAAETLQTIRDRLEERRVIGSRLLVGPPLYKGVTVVARLRARPRRNPVALREVALERLYTYLNPLSGGPERTGWPFGRPVNIGELFGVLQAIPGTELVEDVRLFAADPVTGQRGQATQRIDLERHSLVFSYEHQVLVDAS